MLFAAALAMPVGVLRNGSLRRLLAIRFRWIPLLGAALLIQVGFEIFASNPDPALKTTVTVDTFLLALVFVVVNTNLGGMKLVATGLLLNLVAIASNGAMPVSEGAAHVAGVPISGLNDGMRHEVLGHSTVVPWLTDLFPIPHLGVVFSLGDVVIAIGIALLILFQMTHAPQVSGAARGSASG